MGAIFTFVLFSVCRACRFSPHVFYLVPLASRQVLMQIASNSRSFSLYAKLGFEVQGEAFASLLEHTVVVFVSVWASVRLILSPDAGRF